MAQLERIFIADDSSSTYYYETWYRISGTTAWSQQNTFYPLPTYTTVSPAFSSAYIALAPLADATDYEYKVRRFDLDGNASNWFEGTFTTGS